MTTRWARVARGWMAALVSTFIAVCSHALAGGGVPGAAGIALCLVFSGVACILLAGRTLSTPRLAAAVVTSQFMFHGLFGMLTGASASASAAGSMASAAESMSFGSESMSSGSESMSMSMSMGLPMWTGHAVAAAITVIALRFGERAFWQLVAVTTLTITWLLTQVCLVATEIRTAPPADAARRALLPRSQCLFLSIHPHRGPPAAARLH